ncbi:amino acid/polyamine transporter I [Dactylonectria estremocensis]|uniref:Amino acid/polyamine transporter I n=1 Tax=Dactylonectria estremocensis TaxID=1079267 RepID=A0A9P9DMX8_9HYPO|nr:amino acid/polyamine transporter I [Dactylonectria estremocensis]
MSEKIATKPEAGNSVSDVELEATAVLTSDGELQRNFGVWTFCAQAIVLPGSWAFAATALTIAIFGGGAPVAIWGTICISACLCIVVACLAEFGSAYPSAAGCTHIASKVAGPEWGRFCGYMTGAFHCLGGVFSPPAFLVVLSQLILTCAAIFHDEYNPTRWQVFLIYQFWNVVALFVLLYGSRVLPLLSSIAFVFLAGGLFVTIGLLVGFAPVKAADEIVWFDFQNLTGFESPIMCAMLGLLGPIYGFGPPHFILNMAEDVKNPARNLPIGLAAQQIGSTIMLLGFYVAAYYTVVDYDALFQSTFPSVVGAVYLDATRNRTVSLVLLLIVLAPAFFACFSYFLANIRLLYGFARDGAVPSRAWFSKVDARRNIPINMLYVSTFINFLLGFIYLGSRAGFSIILGSSGIFYGKSLVNSSTLREHILIVFSRWLHVLFYTDHS